MNRIAEIDFAKGILIILMVAYHLTPFVSSPIGEYTTPIVYSFHMSGFLLLSGYLSNPQKEFAKFFKSTRFICTTYLFFEIIYLVGLSLLGNFLGSSNRGDEMNLMIFLHKIIFSPVGTYWYLHTLFICLIVQYVINKSKLSEISNLLLTGSVLFILSHVLKIVEFENVMYFLIGSYLRILVPGKITLVIKPSLLFLIVSAMIVCCCEDLQRGSLGGLCLTISALGFLFCVNKGKNILYRSACYLGRNSLAIVCFSPVFTVFMKSFAKFFTFDETMILFALLSTGLITTACILSAKIIDKIKISQIIFGANMIKP